MSLRADATEAAELRGVVAADRVLWRGAAQHCWTFLLTMVAFAGSIARARIAGGTDKQRPGGARVLG